MCCELGKKDPGKFIFAISTNPLRQAALLRQVFICSTSLAGIQAADCHEKGKEKNTTSKGQSQRVLDYLLLAEEIHSHESLWTLGANRIMLKGHKFLEFRWEAT